MLGSDQRLMAAVDRYLRSIEEGTPIDREVLFQEFADVADELKDCLGSLDFLDDAGRLSVLKTGAEARQNIPSLNPPQNIACSDEDLRVDSLLGDYRLKNQLGRGGMGVVYEAEQLSLQRRVAVKLLPFATALEERQIQRFRHEAMAAASLHHPHIVPVFMVGYDNGTHYYVMQLIVGESLNVVSKRKKEFPQKPAQPHSREAFNDTSPVAAEQTGEDHQKNKFQSIVASFYSIADALEHAHKNGIVHRDVKPSNLLLDRDGKLWLTDFGLAMRTESLGLTLTGDLVGTLRYMSPEQIMGNRQTVDHRSDIYSLGLTLYEFLSGTPAYDGQNKASVIRQVAESNPKPLKQLNPKIPAALQSIVEKAMSEDPVDRYQTAGAMAADLLAFSENRPVSARRPRLSRRLSRWIRKHRLAVQLTASLGCLIVIGLSMANVMLVAEQDRTERALQDSMTILNEYYSTVAETTEVVTESRLNGQPVYAQMLQKFSHTTLRCSKQLQNLAHDHADVRLSLMKHLQRLAAASWLASDHDTGQDLFGQLRPLALRHLFVLRQEGGGEQTILFKKELAQTLDVLGTSEFYAPIKTSNWESRFDEIMKMTEIATSQNPNDASMWFWLGRAIRQKSRLSLEVNSDQRVVELKRAVEFLAKSRALEDRVDVRSELASSYRKLRDLFLHDKNYQAASEFAAKLFDLQTIQLSKDFSVRHAEEYCDAARVHSQLLTRSQKREQAAVVNDVFFANARKAAIEFGTTNLTTAFVAACRNRLHDFANGIRPSVDPGALVREARRTIYPKGSKETVITLGLAAMRAATSAADDEERPVAERIQLYEEWFSTLLIAEDIGNDFQVMNAETARLVERVRQNSEKLKGLIERREE